ncbi:hypothetical protein V1264_006733 [Littorina saxatilis]|uniref:Uncharacterized protein n=2 Tax=Littorina saxatilis TaxID=31220 RepID=A0AAN9AXP0_9CAEN
MQRSTFVHTTLVLLFVLFTTLHVTAQIVWLSKPLNTPTALGQDLVLNCHVQKEAQSGGKISVSWLFNQSAVQAKALRMANDSLFLPGVDREDEGEYTCVVEMVGAGGQVEREEESALVIIAYIKDFILQPENASAAIGSEAVLTCVTGRSAPYPIVHWEKNGRKIENARTFAASYGDFDHTGLSDQISMKLMYRVLDGNPLWFQCVAVNPLSGETVKSRPAFVTPEIVDVPPQILTHFPPERVAREFQRLILDCKAIGNPPPVVSWYKDGALIEDPKIYNFKIMSNDTLVMPSVRPAAAGVYSCEAENSVGIAQSGNISIVVAYLELNFATEPSHTSALAGTPATLHCTPPPSVPPAEVTWYKDYAPFVERAGVFAARVVHNGTQRNLHFFSVQEMDEGDYYCVATNGNTIPTGRTSVIARLTVEGAPVITEPPINTQVIKGTLLHLTCRVDLATVRSVFWMFNADMVQTSADVSIINHGQDLWINNVGKSWEGLYTCTAENSYGKKSASAVVSVIVPPVTLKSLGAKSVTVNYAILLPCFVYGDPGPAFVWYHNGTLVTGDAKHRLLTTGLYIDPVSIDDRGSYSCKGNNSGGFAWSNGTLDVTVPPTADTGEKQVAAVVGKPLTLRCQVQGHPFPSVLWLHNGTSSAERGVVLSQDNRTVTIPVFTWAHSGQYTCLAQNDVGSDMSTAVVSTQVKPKVLQIVGKTSVDVQRSLNLTCVVEGVPTPRISWVHDGNSVQGTLNSRVSFPTPASLLVKFVTKIDEGVYECVATNIAGSCRGNVSVVIVEPPRPPKLLEAKALSVNSVFLRWEHVFQPPSTDVNTFVVHYRKRVDGDTVDYVDKMSALTTEKEIDGLDAGTEYVFTVSAENSAGQGIHSNPLSAVTFESGPSEPVNFRMVRTSATTATVVWETPSDTNGNIQRYQLQFKKQGEKDYSVLGVTSTSSPTQTVMLESLAPYTNYSLRVRGANVWQGNTMWGLFETLSLLTNMTVPSAPPLNVRATMLDPFSVLVTWQPVPVSQQNGPITRYRVTYRLELDYAVALGSLTRNGSQDSATITRLSPWTWYSFTVEAENPKGFSPKSDILTIRTNPTAPTAPPQSVTVSALPGDILHVDWQPIPAKHRNSDLSVYVAQYRLAGDDSWTEVSTSDNKTLSITIRQDFLS